MQYEQFRDPPPATIADADVRAELQRILSSPAFASQERLQKFLSYVVERSLDGHAAELKETTIGFDVFERRADYDAKVDPIVRVQARRLRDKLAEYYDSPGNGARVRITIPKGGYLPGFAPVTAASTPVSDDTAPAPTHATPTSHPSFAISHSSGSNTSATGSRTDRRVLYFTLGIAAAIGVAIVSSLSRPAPHSPPAASIRQFAGGRGTYNHPAFSPDGRRIAFDWDGPDFDNTDIYVQSLDSDAPQRLTSAPAEEVRPAWSPDGNYISFLRRLPENRAAIVVVPAGGGPERIVDVIDAVGDLPRVDWSPDGANLVTSRMATPNSPTHALILVSAASGSQRMLTNPGWGTPGDTEATFSPDGSSIAFERATSPNVEDVFVVPARGGDARQLTSDSNFLSGLAWARDSSGVVFGSTRDGGDYALWRVPAKGGSPVRITATAGRPAFPSVAPHGDRIAFAVRIEDPNIWRLDLDSHGLAGSGPATPVAQSTATDANPALSPDGALLAFRSGRTGISEIWLSDALGKSARRLTECNGGWCGNPDWSPDGRLLAYEATRNGSPQIYIISRDGGAAKRLSSTQETTNETMPHWSRDGHSIYCASNASGEYQIWKRHLEGGPPEQITRSGGYSAQESFDGHSIFFTKSEAKSGLWRQSLAGGPEELVAPQLPANMWGNWRVTKNGVYFISFVWEERPFTQTLYFYDSATGQVRVAARVPGIAMPFSAGLAVSADERSVYFVQVDRWGVGIYFAEDIKW